MYSNNSVTKIHERIYQIYNLNMEATYLNYAVVAFGFLCLILLKMYLSNMNYNKRYYEFMHPEDLAEEMIKKGFKNNNVVKY